jgi:hypothetical protein
VARLLIITCVSTTLALSACGGGAGPETTGMSGARHAGLSPSTKRALKVRAKPVSPIVKPKSGSPETPIVVAFTAGDRTGVIGQARRGYEAYVRGPGRIGCQFDTAAGGRYTRAGQPVRIVLDPGEMEGPNTWCSGPFHGTVKLQIGYACPSHGACQIPKGFPRIRPRTVGHFRFEIQQ